MKTKKPITEQLVEVLENEKVRISEKGGTLSNAFSKFLKIGIDTKSTYTFPLKDTIGKTFREQIQFKNQ
jgi:hypothetical protein